MLRPYGRTVRRLEASATNSRLFRGGFPREGLGLFHKLRESGHVLDRHVREDFAINGNAGGLQAMNELPVGQTILASGSADTLNPQAPVLALFHAAIAFCVAIRAIGGFLCGLVELTFGEEETFRPLEILLTPSPALGAAFYAWHGFSPSYAGNETGCGETRGCASSNGFVFRVIGCRTLRLRRRKAAPTTAELKLGATAPRTGRNGRAGPRGQRLARFAEQCSAVLVGPRKLSPTKVSFPAD